MTFDSVTAIYTICFNFNQRDNKAIQTKAQFVLLFKRWVFKSRQTSIIHYLHLRILVTMQNQKIHVWLDCDPGLDDTFAIILAARTARINLLGVSTSAGNTNIFNTTKNALDVLFNIHREDVIVVRGSEVLVQGELHLAQHMHGSGGLGGVELPPSPRAPVVQDNFKTIRDILMACPDKLVWANTGALTNLCLLFRQFPEVKTKIQKIVIMGGAIGRGNITPAAEFNVYFDPVAFKEVLEQKHEIPLVMVPLQLTHEVKARDQIFGFLQKRDQNPLAHAILSMLRSYKEMYFRAYQFDAPPIHDPCVINYILHPEHFDFKKAKIEVDTYPTSWGRTNCYFENPSNPKLDLQTHDIVCLRMNKRRKFWGLFEKIFEVLFKQNQA